MKKFLFRLFRMKDGEAKLVFVLGAILFVNYAAMGITKVIAVSGFLSEVKDHYILLVWAIDMVLLILATALQSLIIDRYNRISLLSGVLLVFSLLYFVLPLAFLSKTFPTSISYALLYLLNDQQWRFFPVVFWILVNDIYAPAQGRRLFPVIANFAFLGTIVGLGVAALDANINIGAVKLLYFNAIIFLLAVVITRIGFKGFKMRKSTAAAVSMTEAFSEGWTFIKTIPAFAYESLSMLSAGIIMTILLYKTLSDAKLDLGDGFQSFYAQYSLLIAVGSILVQSFATRFIEKISLKNRFLIQPVVMLFGTVINFLVPGYIASASAQGAARVSYDTVDLSSRKSLEALVPNERRGRVSMFIDSYLPSMGTIIGSMITFGIISLGIELTLLREEYSLIYVGLAIFIALLAIYSGNKVRKTYDMSMLNWQLKRRSRESSMFDQLDFSDEEGGK